MSKKTDPPKLAIWWLRHAFLGNDNEALAGDLIERFHEGQTRGWFWRQVLIAFAVGILSEVRSHWPQICYAIAGVGIHVFLWRPYRTEYIRWNVLPLFWSVPLFELTTPAIFAMAALPILAAGLAMQGAFRWISLLRTAKIVVAVITLIHFTGLLAWLMRLGVSLFMWRLIFPIQLFFSFLVPAWLGCRSPRRADAESSVA